MAKINEAAHSAAFPWADENFWSRPEYYSTIRLADIDGDGKVELLVRNEIGLLAFSFDDARGQWQSMPVPVLPFPDSDGWNLPQYYSTFRTGDIDGDGKDELLVRGSSGVVAYNFDEVGNAWRPIAAPPLELTDASGWNRVEYFSTLIVADINGDGKAEVLARAGAGVKTFGLNASRDNWEELSSGALIPLTDANDWNRPEYYLTIIAADINGDGKAEILARGGGGVDAYSFNLETGAWQLLSANAIPWTDDLHWNLPQQYSTIVAADVNGDGQAEVLGRGPDGIQVYSFVTNSNAWQQLGEIPFEVTWEANDITYYSGIMAADVDGDGKAEVLVRGMDGLHIFQFDDGEFRAAGLTRSWMSDDSFFDTQAADHGDVGLALNALAPQLGFDYSTDSGRNAVAGWATRAHAVQPYYSTLRVADVNGDDRAEVVAITRQAELVTLKWDGVQPGIVLIATQTSPPPPPLPNYALDLNGDQQWVDFSPYQIGPNDFTLEAWIATSDSGPIFSTSDVGLPREQDSSASMSLVADPDGSLTFSLRDQFNTNYLVSSPTPVLDGEWHHVAVVRQGVDVTVYVDGDAPEPSQNPRDRTKTPPAPVVLFRDLTLYFGTEYVSSLNLPTFFKGIIDEVRFWRRALAHDEIVKGMHHLLTGGEAALIGHWSFDQQNASDSSPTATNGNLRGQPAFVSSELDFAPAGEPYLITQAKLMQDYLFDPQTEQLTEINGFRTIITAQTFDGNPRQTELTITASEPTILHFLDGTSVTTDQQSPITKSTDPTGELSFVIEADSERLYAAVLKVRADFMTGDERLVISPDRHAHDELASITGNQLRGKDAAGNPDPDVVSGQRPVVLPDSVTEQQANDLARTIRNLMSTAVGHDIQPERSQIQLRALPEDLPAPRPYVPRYQNVAQLSRSYDAKTDVIAAHFLPIDQPITRIAVAENMTVAHWQWDQSAGTFTEFADEDIDNYFLGKTVRHLDDLARLFDGQRTVTVSADALLDAATGQLSKRGFGSSIVDMVKDGGKVIVKTAKAEVAAAEAGAKAVSTIIVTIENAAHELYDGAVQTVEDAAALALELLKKMAAEGYELWNDLKALFDWDDILKTQRVLECYLEQLTDCSKQVVVQVKDKIVELIGDLKSDFNTHVDEAIARLGAGPADSGQTTNAPPEDVQSKYIRSLISNNITKVSGPSDFDFDNTLGQSLTNSLLAGLPVDNPQSPLNLAQTEVINKILGNEEIMDLLANPAKLIGKGLPVLLEVLKEIVDLIFDLVKTAAAVILDLLTAIIDEMKRLCKLTIEIPFVTALYQKITRGGTLNLYSVMALSAATPLTIAYKTITEKKEFFSDDDYSVVKNSSWQDYDWVNSFISALLGNSVATRTAATGELKGDLKVRLLWAAAYGYSGSTLLWGYITTLEDLLLTAEQPRVLAKPAAVVKLVAQALCFATGVPTVLIKKHYTKTDWDDPSFVVQGVIWLSQLVPFASNVAAYRSATWSSKGDAVFTGVYGMVEGAAYVALYVIQLVVDEVDPGEAYLQLAFLNLPSSGEWSPQAFKLLKATKILVPVCDAIAYATVAGATAALTTRAIAEA